MEVTQDQIDALVASPAEGLNVELKCWIDPATPEGQAKIIRACLALRNRNGGFLVIGFDDKTLKPDRGQEPANVRATFHVDDIQGLISKYAYDLFEVTIGFSERDGVEHPVVAVPTGVQFPVAAKRNLPGPNGKSLISRGDVYFRTLSANGTPSTSVAHPEDWREIFQICFDNRESDIGRFLRRQLSNHDKETLVAALREVGLGMLTSPPPPSLREKAFNVLQLGEERFRRAFDDRKLEPDQKTISKVLTWRVALVVEPDWKSRVPDSEFLAKVLGSNPNYTGWPIWLDARSGANEENRPQIVDKAWEALIVLLNGGGLMPPRLDFMRLDPRGQFFLRRALQDDLTDKVKPGAALDPLLAIIRVAEAIAVGISITRALMEEDREPRRLGFAFQWTGLAGRHLTPWANPMMFMMGSPQAHDNEVSTFAELASDTPISSIAPFVDEATRDLFATFQGERIPLNVIEDWTSQLVERRLGR